MHRRLALAVCIAALALPGCKKKKVEPPPDPTTIHHCSIEDAKVQSGRLELARISIRGREMKSLRPDGTLTVDVRHKTTEPGSTPMRVCGGSGTLTVGSYAPNDFATTSVALDGKCAPPPAGHVIEVRSSFLAKGKNEPFICSFLADIPGELGGTGQSVAEQRARVEWEKLAQTEPKVAAPIIAYRDQMPKVVSAVGDPTKERKATTCAAAVKGPATLFAYGQLRAIAAMAKDGPANVDVDEPRTASGAALAGDALATDLGSVVRSSPREFVATSKRVDELSKAMVTAPRWVVVMTTRSYQMPQIKESPGSGRKGIYVPGAFYGDVAVVDRQSGTLACGAPFSATTTATTTNPGAELLSAIQTMAWQGVAKIAPGLAH